MGKSNFSLTELLKDDIRATTDDNAGKKEPVQKKEHDSVPPVSSPKSPRQDKPIPHSHPSNEKTQQMEAEQTYYSRTKACLKINTLNKINTLSRTHLLTKKEVINQLLDYALSVYEEKNGKIKTIEKKDKKLL